MEMKVVLSAGVVLLSSVFSAWAGSYAPAADQPGSTAIHKDDASFVAWATACSVDRGPMNIATPSLGNASYGNDTAGTGKADNVVVSLGDGGSATLTFSQALCDGDGYDFAVFENSFSDTFLELAFVEVSSDGMNFFRFDSVSQTQTASQVGGFGTLDCTNLHNLAGKYRLYHGTPFDLSELSTVSPLLNVNRITHVRLVDVVGCIQDGYCSYDSLGNKVNDPWATGFASGGFDLDAVGVIHQVPEPMTLAVMILGGAVAARRRRVA